MFKRLFNLEGILDVRTGAARDALIACINRSVNLFVKEDTMGIMTHILEKKDYFGLTVDDLNETLVAVCRRWVDRRHQRRNLQIIQMLVKEGASLDVARSEDGSTPLMYALADNPEPECLKYLLESFEISKDSVKYALGFAKEKLNPIRPEGGEAPDDNSEFFRRQYELLNHPPLKEKIKLLENWLATHQAFL